MNLRISPRKPITSALAVVGFVVAGCTGHPLEKLNFASNVVVAYGAVDAHFCTDPPAPVKEKLKYLFILDHSASNQPGFFVPGDATATDVQGSHRYGQLVNFVNNLVPNADAPTAFAAIDFSDAAQQPVGLSGFDTDPADFVTKITADWVGSGTPAAPAPDDSGYTNYVAALNLAQQMILTDAQNEYSLLETPPVRSAYVVIFVSDGVPVIPGAGGVLIPQTFTGDITPAINAIFATKDDVTYGPLIGNITLSTAYYSGATTVPGAQTLLAQMAELGNGQPLQFNSGTNVLYDQFAPAARSVRNQLIDVFLQNENTVWWKGDFMADADGDGLPDVIELQEGSDPGQADTDGNGVGDLVEYRTKGHVCLDPSCAPAGRDQYGICTGYTAGQDATGRVTMTSTTNDGLNDCEKFVLGATRTAFNSNGTLVPDQFAFFQGLPILPGSGPTTFADPFADGLQNYAKLKLGLPVGASVRTVSQVNARAVSLLPEASPSVDVSCYHYVAENVAMGAEVNQLRLMFVQNAAVAQNKPYLKMARSPISIEQNVARFSPGDFK